MRLHPRFLPSHLIESLARRRRAPAIPSVDRFEAALLFSDISGFTALTERLQAGGRAGAEEVSDVLRRRFAVVVDSVLDEGGSILNFAGDGAFSIFPGAGAVRRASRAAERIREDFGRSGGVETSLGRVPLTIAQYVHWGEVRGAHLGERGRAVYLASGPSVCALGRMEKQSAPGRVVVSRAAQQRLSRERGVPRRRPVKAGGSWKEYVPGHLREIDSGFEGDFRPVAVVFLECRGYGRAFLQSIVLRILHAMDSFEGVLVSPDVSPAGTKFLCAFGATRVREGDPERAVRAALRIVGEDSRVRAAVHTGTAAAVLMGTRRRQAFDLLGDVLNTAARAMGQTPWGEVSITARVRDRVPAVETAPRGVFRMKGKAALVELHRATAVGSRSRRADAGPMVGRDRELKELRRAMNRAFTKEGGAVTLIGEAGMGKSRMKEELARLARFGGAEVHLGRAQPVGDSAWGLAAQLVRSVLNLELGADASILKESVAASGLGEPASRHLLDVLGVDDRFVARLDPRSRREGNLAAVAELMVARRATLPQLLILEDLHWANATTRSLAERLATKVAGSRTMLLLIQRPDAEPWEGVVSVELGELTLAAVKSMIRDRLGSVSRAVASLLMERSGGNPLYVEEGLRHLLDLGVLVAGSRGYRLTRSLGPEDLPAHLEVLIRARLERLSSSGRRLAQRAAVMGRRFSASILGELESGDDVSRGLEELQEGEIAFPLGGDDWVFKHALTRDAAYASILTRHRRRLHQQVALAFEARYGTEASVYSALLGHHWQRAGERVRAREHLFKGAELSTEHFAHDEADRLYRQVIELCDGASVERVKARNDLAHRVLYGQGRLKEARAEHRRALREAVRIGDRVGEAESNWRLGIVSWQSDRLGAAPHYEKARELARREGVPSLEARAIHYLGMLRHQEGDLDEASRLYERAQEMYEELGDRVELAKVVGVISILRYGEGKMAEALSLARRALRISREEGDIKTQGDWTSNIGMILAETDRPKQALAMFEQSLEIRRRVGDERAEGLTLNNLGLVLSQLGRHEEARATLERAARTNRKVGNLNLEGYGRDALAGVLRSLGEYSESVEEAGRAVALFEKAGDLRSRAFARHTLSWSRYLLDGDAQAAHGVFLELAESLRSDGSRLELCPVVCNLGHLQLALGRSAADRLAEAGRLVKETAGKTGSRRRASLDRLRRAQRAFEGGETLVRGMVPDDLPGRTAASRRGQVEPGPTTRARSSARTSGRGGRHPPP